MPTGHPPSTPEDLALIRQSFGVTTIFSSWPNELLERLLPVSRLRRHLRGDLVHSETLDTPEILTVVSGHIMVARLHVGDAYAPIAILGPSFVIGIPRGLNPDDEALHAYHAHDDAVVVHIPAEAVFQTLGTKAMLWKGMARMLSRQHRQIVTTVLDQLSGSTRRRLAAAIGGLARIYGMDDGSLRLRLRLSQEDLAALLQVTRRSINREMRVLEEMALLRSEYNGVTILDLSALNRLASSATEISAWPGSAAESPGVIF